MMFLQKYGLILTALVVLSACSKEDPIEAKFKSTIGTYKGTCYFWARDLDWDDGSWIETYDTTDFEIEIVAIEAQFIHVSLPGGYIQKLSNYNFQSNHAGDTLSYYAKSEGRAEYSYDIEIFPPVNTLRYVTTFMQYMGPDRSKETCICEKI